jgi:filamentous hemagglutinin family protein
MKKPHREHDRFIRPLIFSLSLFLAIPCSFSLAQAVTPITSSGLNTQIGAPTILPGGQTVYDITGGTRPGNGPNLFHSFGDFNVPNHNIANFLNDSGLATSNILGRVTGGNISNIFGTIQTTGFGNANLFLMNPAGFLFGPNATVNVGGMVSFTSADYLRLADGVRFNAIPTASADALLSAAPVAAFGFLGSNPGAITVQGSQLTVTEGAGISLVGGDITVQAGTLTAPSGEINLVSVGRPSNPKVGGEVVVGDSDQGSGFTPTGFGSLGTITLTQGSSIDVSAIESSGIDAGSVVIRGGQFVMNDSAIKALAIASGSTVVSGGTIEVTAEQVNLSNHSTIDARLGAPGPPGSAGDISFNVGTFSATDSAILAEGSASDSQGGSVVIQGLQGPDTFARSVSLTNTEVDTSAGFGGSEVGGPILLRANNIALNQSTLNASGEIQGGPITLESRGGLGIRNSSLHTSSLVVGGAVHLNAGEELTVTGTLIDTSSQLFPGGPGSGSIIMTAPFISLSGSTLQGGAPMPSNSDTGIISLTGTKIVSLKNTMIDGANGGSVQINGGALFTSQQSTISARGGEFSSSDAMGGTIHVEANKIVLTDTLLTTSTSGGPQSVAGSISVEAKNTTLTNSQILSTATEGQGGTIDITSSVLHQAGSVIDASSQSGTDGTVTINGIIQP